MTVSIVKCLSATSLPHALTLDPRAIIASVVHMAAKTTQFIALIPAARHLLPLMLVSAFSVVANAQNAATDTTEIVTEKMTAKMRPVDRDWNYFKSIRCNDIHQVVHHSRSEEILIAKRKSQCLDKYKAFLPTPIDR